jgi:hypothetical protein
MYMGKRVQCHVMIILPTELVHIYSIYTTLRLRSLNAVRLGIFPHAWFVVFILSHRQEMLHHRHQCALLFLSLTHGCHFTAYQLGHF